MEQQNVLLKKILIKLDPSQNTENISHNDFLKNSDSKKSNVVKQTDDKDNIYENLSEKEKQRADEFIKFGINQGQILAIQKVTREINRFDPNEWQKLVNKAEDSDWEIILRK